MEASAYSGAYDNSSFAARYQYVASHCGLSGITNFKGTGSAVTGATTVNITAPVCASGNHYTVKSGDTCDTIAVANSVSSATLFAINPSLQDCRKALAVGTVLCLPHTCDALWTVQSTDTCLSIGNATGNSQSALVAYNTMLNWNCTNLVAALGKPPSWGSTLCVSSPGGVYDGIAASNSSVDGNGGGGNGYAGADEVIVDPPTGATVATGTNATECAKWYVYDATLLCAQICLTNDIPISIFTKVNPSLHATSCDSDLVKGHAYCVSPVMELSDESSTTTTTATTKTSTTTTKPTTTTATTTTAK
ncbi:hypothetical protein Sste5346_007917 [Sporothrix stenoceras]|uniref:LysM domain-containing protein n=1 Tax=Sporothrix stenoceras TaxID=5173 RepID=A0ABR3YS02_9PEZI